jgi:hypothetical protein
MPDIYAQLTDISVQIIYMDVQILYFNAQVGSWSLNHPYLHAQFLSKGLQMTYWRVQL